MTLTDILREWWALIVFVLGSTGLGGYVTWVLVTRQTVAKTNTVSAREAAHQHGALGIMAILDEARKDAASLRDINQALRKQFDITFADLRERLKEADERCGVLLADVAEWRGKYEGLHAQHIDLQAAIQRQRHECNEEKRALTAGYERTIASLRTEIGGLNERNHVLVNQLYGDGTATSIMGPTA